MGEGEKEFPKSKDVGNPVNRVKKFFYSYTFLRLQEVGCSRDSSKRLLHLAQTTVRT